MRKRGMVLAAIAVVIVIAVNALTYTTILNSSNTLLNLYKRLNLAYVTPRTYVNLAKKLPKKPNYSNNSKQVEAVISAKSEAFIEAAFEQDAETIKELLDSRTKYIKSKDGSSFIRFTENGMHVEGYMATDKRLLKAKQRWHVIEDDNTVTCSMELYIEGIKSPQLWYLHFKKVKSDWKIFMLENGI